MTPSPEIRVALLGAGYISSWHADAVRSIPGLKLVAVCDRSEPAARKLASSYGIDWFSDLDLLIASGRCDAVHILTPPPLHRDLAVRCLDGGLHVLVEKPVTLSVADLDVIAAAAARSGKALGVCHNFLGLPSWLRLRRIADAGDLGLVSSIQVNWSLPLPPMRSGPYGIWLMRETRNLLLELGPHPFAFAVDMFGPLEIDHVTLGQWIDLPGGESRPQSWRILARAGRVDVTINLSLVETFDDRSVTLRGSSGLARLDYAADTLTVSRDNTSELVINPLRKQIGLAGAHLREGLRNAWLQAMSLNQKSPYGQSFCNTVAGFYDGLRQSAPDRRFGPEAARNVMQAIETCLAHLPQTSASTRTRPAEAAVAAGTSPRVMVIGGTGFIGRNLTRRLVARGHGVRVLSRGASGPFADLGDAVQLSAASMHDEEALVAAMTGIGCVFNLARSNDATWEDALENDVGVALRISRAARRAGVRRMVYTGTIASYDMSDPARVITEDLPLTDMEDRNLYARSKAECERRLLEIQAGEGVPVVIARPGIVLGDGGPLQHWGIGRWHGPGAVRLWGNGRNPLPFVLVDDVSDGLIAMMDAEGLDGQDFNLVGDPILGGRDYFDAIHRRLGARLRVSGSNLTLLWLADIVKQGLKRHVLRRRGAKASSRVDWLSRGHLSRFDNSKARRMLGWAPESDPEAFLTAAIDRAHLFW
jgi:predicted dehydrogenase/nucleoside-diphosphate-sugar epimerase